MDKARDNREDIRGENMGMTHSSPHHSDLSHTPTALPTGHFHSYTLSPQSMIIGPTVLFPTIHKLTVTTGLFI